MANPNDAIRNQILLYFYERNASATSRMGKKGLTSPVVVYEGPAA